MLEYEWGNPSSMLLSGEEPTQDSDQTRQILVDHYNQNLAAGISLFPSQPNNNYHHHQSFHEQQQQQQQHQTSSPLQLYDPKIYSTNNVLSYPSPANPPTTFLPESMAQQITSSNFMMMMPKNEDICGQRVPTTTTTASASIDFSTRIGLNLGGRTYFSSEDDFVNRFYRRSRHLEPGPANIPRCQAEGCNADLTHSKHYHRRHKVCEFHSKAATVLTAGITQRFCQQCSRFHLLTEFDQGKRSCRKRLADHNRRRRKSNPPPPPPPPSTQQQQSQLRNTTTTDQQNPTRSSPDSGGMHSSSSSVTVAAMSHMEGHSALRIGGHN